MIPFIKKLLSIVKNLIIIVTLIFVAMDLLFTIASSTYLSQKDICEIVLENQCDLEMIVDDLHSYDMARVHVNKENITTYMSLDCMPNGQYFLGDKGPDYPTSEELQRFMRKLKITSIDFSLFDELQIVTFEFYGGWIKGAYWVDPDTPTEKAYTSHHDLTPSEDGWEYTAHGERYYTEKICDHWYYFVVES